MGIFLVASGAAMVLARPIYRPSWLLAGLLVVVCAGSLLAFLPQSLFGIPEWREAMGRNGAIPLAASVALMPSYTAFWCVILAASCAVAIFLNGFPLRTSQLAWFALGVSVVTAGYAVVAIATRQTGADLPSSDAPRFGFFPNRNHTGTFLTLGAIVSMATSFHFLRNARYARGTLACICCLPLLGALLFYNESRAGVLNLGLGVAIWLLGVGRRHMGRRALIVLGVVIAYATFQFVLEKNPARDRLMEMVGAVREGHGEESAFSRQEPGDPTLDFRLLVFEDTLRLCAAFPATGVGLGNFQFAFPHCQAKTLREARVIHPESDWLMMVAEMGPLPLVALAGALVVLFRRLWNERASGGWPLRWGVATAAIVVLLHGLIDVPMHRVALGWFVLVVGLAAFTSRDRSELLQRRGLAWVVHVIAGLALCGMGLTMVRSAWFRSETPPPFRGAYYQERLKALGQERRFDEAEQLAAASIKELPMLGDLYYWRAAYLLTFADTDTEAAQNFAAARLVDPIIPLVGIQEARLWMPIDANRAADAWLEAVERGSRIDQSIGDTTRRCTVRCLTQALSETGQQPAIQRTLLQRIRDNTLLVATWIRRANEDLARSVIAEYSEPTELFSCVPPSDRAELLSRWIRLGNPRPAVTLMESAQESSPPPGPYWKILSHYYADTGQFERAVRCAAKAMQISMDVRWQHAEADSKALTPFETELRKTLQDQNVVATRRLISEAEQAANPSKNSLQTVIAYYAGNHEWEKAWRVVSRLE